MPKMTNLESLRQAWGESRNALSVAVGVSRTTIIKLETGETQEPTYSLVIALADHFDVDPSALFLPAQASA
ncbi:helix-turn-helix transcriptional regulator [Deinococcus sp.]|uniref:helix-turn-helix transcriptional regulator n=1 Tax=Deinococcus sp. TaxID=47478 RepID=UPI0025D56ADA|nr:helix-turn-helix transcriptional regulator [Deinococcus sp.]